MVNIHAKHVLEPQSFGSTFDECHVVDGEAVFERRESVQLVEDCFGGEPGLDLDDQAQSVFAIRQIDHVRNARDLLFCDAVLDAFNDAFGADEVGEFGDDDAGLPRGNLLDGRASAGPERPLAGLVCLADAIETDDNPSAGKVGTWNEGHEVVKRRIGVSNEVPCCLDYLAKVVWRHVCRHAHSDSAGTVHQQIGERSGQDFRLEQLPVVVGDEVNDVFVETLRHGHCLGSETGLGVAAGSGAVVERTEIPVSVDEGNAQAERLRQADECVVDRAIAVRVQLAHHLADNSRALDVPLVGTQSHVGHLIDDSTLYRLQSVSSIRKRARIDYGVGVFEERPLHLVGKVNIVDAFGEGWGVSHNEYDFTRHPARGPLARRGVDQRVQLNPRC